MILDRSVLVAIVMREPNSDRLLARMREAPRIAIGAATLLEAGIVIAARLAEDARGRLTALLEGTKSAALNFGDCLSYAMAIVANEPLLCVGDDFPQTDCQLA